MKKQILLVVDNHLLYVPMKLLLARNSFELVWASSTEKAIAFCSTQSQTIDLVLMDNQVPNVAGFEASKLIKNISPSLPIICISEESIPHYYRHYFVAHHQRTVDFNQLMPFVRQLLSR